MSWSNSNKTSERLDDKYFKTLKKEIENISENGKLSHS